MFYSQFILAKKGPLGTIWIAAHLERKLRKNQVADTDIGVSVDSILFPEVPIALRLSSHLLLGVVRIYSRKVNYLFHDCSEALLKVKQAFRSTAVDLPPEESTAPYHSITLPETFDLDDFELPDSALLTGNFDDRHVSTREQITLQDTLDGSGYTTSQFGLDERFGDGDASQINLDLDEDLFLDNNLTVQHSSVSLVSRNSNVPQSQGAVDVTKMDVGEDQHVWPEDRDNEASTDLSKLLSNYRGKQVVSDVENSNANDSSHRLIFNIQTPDLNEVFLPDDHIGGPSLDVDMDPPSPEFNGSTNFPSTPGLLEEPVRTSTQDVPAPNLQEISQHTALEGSKAVNQEVDCCDAVNTDPINEASTSPKLTNIPQFTSSPTSVLSEPKPDATGPQDGVIPSSDSVNDNGLMHDEAKDLNLDDTLPVDAALPLVSTDKTTGSEALQPLGATSLDARNSMHIESTELSTSILNETGPNCLAEKESGIEGSQTDLEQGIIKDANSIKTTDINPFSFDFQLRSCTSESNETNLIPQGDTGLTESAQPCNLETPMADKEINFTGSSVGMQGGDFHSTVTTDTDRGVQGNSRDVFVGSISTVNNPMNLSSNFVSSSEFSEPEKMLFAPFGYFNISNDLGQQTTEKGITESDGSVDRISNLSGHKRRLTETTPDLQTSFSPETSGMPRKRRNNDYLIPQDDDLLASILVGRSVRAITPALRVGPTPPLPKPASLKRPRPTPKVGLPKRRKVLIDDTIVLHADIIRQQLINTEDIRRVRKKAPCTRPEIWRIHISSLEDDIFYKSIFTDISEDLISLITQKYGVARNVHSQTDRHHSSAEASVSKISLVPRDIDDKIQEPSGFPNTTTVDAKDQLESPLNLNQLEISGNRISTAEQDVPVDSEVGVVAHGASNSGNECQVLTDSRTGGHHGDRWDDPELILTNKESQISHEVSEINNSLHECTFEDFNNGVVAANNVTSIQPEDVSSAKVASLCVEDLGVGMVNRTNLDNGGSSTSLLDRFVVEVGADFPADSSIVIGYTNLLNPDVAEAGEPIIRDSEVMKEPETGVDFTAYERVGDVSQDPNIGEPHVNFLSVPSCTESERVPSVAGENLCMKIDGGLDVEITPMEFTATRETSDFCSAISDIDTDFLNADDEVEYDDETNNDVPSTEEAQCLENSGWSSRTRGVARYLKNMFDEGSGRGRKSVAIDTLLASKTRKEASRMFFETLVLKTKDYIHVEQANPFDYIDVKPRMKLLKSEF